MQAISQNPFPLQRCAVPYGYSPASQKGMALLTVLLLVVAITIVAGSMLASQKIMLREYGVMHDHDQMREYALAGEAFASQLIQQEANMSQTDSLQSLWAKPLPAYPVTDGMVTMKIQDASSRFNLNNLYHDGKVDEQAVSFLKQVFISQQIDPSIVNAIVDWQDPDSDTRPNGGAEADYYQSVQNKTGIVIPNQPFATVDELINVRGMDAQKLTKLRPLLCAVPSYVPMNLNTMRPELLIALVNVKNATNVSNIEQPLTAWANSRSTAIPLQSVEAFWALPFLKTATPPVTTTQSSTAATAIPNNTVNGLVDVRSQAFYDFVTVDRGEHTLYFTSLLMKTNPNSLSNKNLPTIIQSGGTATLNQNSSQNLLQNRAGSQVIAFNRQFLPYLPSGQ